MLTSHYAYVVRRLRTQRKHLHSGALFIAFQVIFNLRSTCMFYTRLRHRRRRRHNLLSHVPHRTIGKLTLKLLASVSGISLLFSMAVHHRLPLINELIVLS